MRQRIYLLALGALWACGSPGKIEGALAQPSFVTEVEPLYVQTSSGLARVQLNGSDRKQIFPAQYSVLDMSQDGAVFVLGDSDTNLYIGHPKSGDIQKIPELNYRASSAKISPDGKTLAAVRHADFSLPQARWDTTEDDAIYLINVATRAVEIVPASSPDWPVALFWSADGESLWLRLMSNKIQRFDLKSRTRTEAEWPTEGLLPSPMQALSACEGIQLSTQGWRGDEGLVLTRAGQEPELLVPVTSRKRGFHDYQPTLEPQLFSKSCAYALFSFSQKLWIVELSSKKVAPLINGWEPFPVP